LLQYVDVRALRHTHDKISQRFLHGPHAGESVAKLTEKLRRREIRAHHITPLVALRWNQHLWVVFGNRRLKALQDFAKSPPPNLPIQVQCIVHKHPGEVSAPLIAKFLLAWSTTNHGTEVEVRGARGAAAVAVNALPVSCLAAGSMAASSGSAGSSRDHVCNALKPSTILLQIAWKRQLLSQRTHMQLQSVSNMRRQSQKIMKTGHALLQSLQKMMSLCPLLCWAQRTIWP